MAEGASKSEVVIDQIPPAEAKKEKFVYQMPGVLKYGIISSFFFLVISLIGYYMLVLMEGVVLIILLILINFM